MQCVTLYATESLYTPSNPSQDSVLQEEDCGIALKRGSSAWVEVDEDRHHLDDRLHDGQRVHSGTARLHGAAIVVQIAHHVARLRRRGGSQGSLGGR
jgi:hypothetical protein